MFLPSLWLRKLSAIIVEDSFYHAIAAFNDKQQLAGFIVRDPFKRRKNQLHNL